MKRPDEDRMRRRVEDSHAASITVAAWELIDASLAKLSEAAAAGDPVAARELARLQEWLAEVGGGIDAS
ncbi:MAG TPA: hypothetical protein VNQ73_14810 [Ilumatobacter sp.]|nr:hypothetical protein [Ilumatobacter sp.]